MSSFIEIYSQLNNDKPYNLHSHTQFCDGRATMAEFAEAAWQVGMSHYGFSPHSPIPLPSTCNMSQTAVLEYLAEADRLKEIYDGRITLLKSMEIDYLDKEWGPAHDFFHNLPLDYLIGSVHFIPNRKGEYYDVDGSPERFARNLAEHFDNDLRYVVETFYSRSIDMVEAGGFDIIGHLDKIGHNASYIDPEVENTGWYMSLVDQLIETVIAHDLTVEINTKAYSKSQRFFPAPQYWPRLIEAGVRIVVNSDAHFTDLISASRTEAIKLLADIRH